MLFQRGEAYSQDLRERVFAAADEGVPVGRIATMLLVSVSYVSKVLSRRRATGVTTALPQVCHVAPKLGDLMEAIRARVAAQPDATLRELKDLAGEERASGASRDRSQLAQAWPGSAPATRWWWSSSAAWPA